MIWSPVFSLLLWSCVGLATCVRLQAPDGLPGDVVAATVHQVGCDVTAAGVGGVNGHYHYTATRNGFPSYRQSAEVGEYTIHHKQGWWLLTKNFRGAQYYALESDAVQPLGLLGSLGALGVGVAPAPMMSCMHRKTNFPAEFPEWAKLSLHRGDLHSMLILSTKFASGELGLDPVLRLPKEATGGAAVEFGVTFLYSRLSRDKKPLIAVYQGNLQFQGKVIFICATPAGSKKTRMKVLRQRPKLHELDWAGQRINASSIVRDFVDYIWDGAEGLEDALFNDLLKRFHDHRFVFCGQSQGATVAQALAVRYEARRQRADKRGAPLAYLLTFGGYRWTDKRGAQLAQAWFGDRQVNFVMAKREKGRVVYDDVVGLPAARKGFASMANMFILDKNSGEIKYCNASESCPADIRKNPPHELLSRVQSLHVATSVIKGLKAANLYYGSAILAESALRDVAP